MRPYKNGLFLKKNRKYKLNRKDTLMKVTQKIKKVKENYLLACYDVSQSSVHFYSEYKTGNDFYGIEEEVKNNPRAVKNHFLELDAICKCLKLKGIHVFFESSGGYENILKRMAQQRNYKISYVSGEATKKARIIESNDDSKSDDKDKRIILTLAQMSKVLSCRILPEAYSRLKQLGLYYEDVTLLGMTIRTRISDIAKCIFLEQSVKSKFLYSSTGMVLVKQFGFSPFKITKYGFNSFKDRMKRHIPKVWGKTLKDIYRKAEAAKILLTEAEADIHEKQLLWAYKEYEKTSERKEDLKEQMCCLYKTLPEYKKLSQIKQIPDSMMARVVGETGPMSDFNCLNKIMRYAGLNIRTRESGKYKGKDRISKKGRPLLRKILYQIVFSSLIKKGSLYHVYFQTKKDMGTKGLVIMTNIMRKIFKAIFGVYKSRLEFDIERIYECNFEYLKKKAAA